MKGICYNTDQLCDDERCYCESAKPPFAPMKVIITVIRDDEAEIERDYIYHKDMDYNAEVAKIINTLEAEF